MECQITVGSVSESQPYFAQCWTPCGPFNTFDLLRVYLYHI